MSTLLLFASLKYLYIPTYALIDKKTLKEYKIFDSINSEAQCQQYKRWFPRKNTMCVRK